MTVDVILMFPSLKKSLMMSPYTIYLWEKMSGEPGPPILALKRPMDTI